MHKTVFLTAGIALIFVACGSKEPQVQAPVAQASAPAVKAAPATSVAHHPDEEEEEGDRGLAVSDSDFALAPLQHQGALPLQVLLPIPDPAPPSGFPQASTTDGVCTKAAGLTGKLERDFLELSTACGKNTGMKEYAKNIEGPLNANHKHEAFNVKLAGGYCYRFFAVADGSIEKLGIRVQRANGSLHSVIQSKQPVAIYRPNQAWCRKHDRDFQIIVESLGGGEGRYAFGIYARPNEKGRAQ